MLLLFQIFGLSLLFCTISVAALMSCFGRIKCCKDSSCSNGKKRYYEVILEEEENVLKDILRTAAKEKLTEEIKNRLGQRGERWETCFDVAGKLIEDSTAPTLPEAAENQVKNQNLLAPC